MGHEQSSSILAGLMLGESEQKIKAAQAKQAAIKKAAQSLSGISDGSKNQALAKAIGVKQASELFQFSRGSTPGMVDILSSGKKSATEFLPTALQDLMGAPKAPAKRGYESFSGNSQGKYKPVSGIENSNYDPGSGVWDVADIKDFDPWSFKTIPVGNTGKSVTVNSAVADRYSGFLKDLLATGYKIDSIGGQVTRNARGSNRPSLHSYGLAIDINPSQNPMTNQLITNMPDNIRDLAARYGIVWGGDWNGSTKDSMHFSFPYNGGK